MLMLGALSTGHKIGLGLVGAAFVVFALVSAFLIPALRPDYPGRRGLPAFLTLTVTLFVGMMFAVFFFGREPSESRAEGGTTGAAAPPPPPPPPATTTNPSTGRATTTAPTSSAPSTVPSAPKTVAVTEVDFKIELPSESVPPGSYKFDLTNKGKTGHDLVVNGPGVSDQKTPVIGPGKTAQLSVDLKRGTYELFCSVPGHKQLGMDLKLKVS